MRVGTRHLKRTMMCAMPTLDLLMTQLRARYLSGSDTPGRVMERLLEVSDAADARHVWITRLSRDQVMGRF